MTVRGVNEKKTWADADTDDAAGYIRRLYEDRACFERIRENGMKQAASVFESGAAERMIRERYKAVTGGNAAAETK